MPGTAFAPRFPSTPSGFSASYLEVFDSPAAVSYGKRRDQQQFFQAQTAWQQRLAPERCVPRQVPALGSEEETLVLVQLRGAWSARLHVPTVKVFRSGEYQLSSRHTAKVTQTKDTGFKACIIWLP